MACSPLPPVGIAGLVACAYYCCREPWQAKRVEERRAGNKSKLVGIMCVLWSSGLCQSAIAASSNAVARRYLCLPGNSITRWFVGRRNN
jgi:hypothetical protein